MDPLSMCASVVALIGASETATKALYSFARYATHAETHVASLCSEITILKDFLSSINKTLRSCRRNARALALVDDELWRQSDLALQDCETALNELSAFVAKVKASEKTAFWRLKVAVDLSIHVRKLDQFRARLKRSNHALQTVLQTITVSVSLQDNASQDRILVELDQLKEYISEAAKRSPVGTQPNLTAQSETMATNLRGLVKAAENFYSSATTIAESSLGGSIADWAPPATENATSIAGLSPFRSERLHEYIRSTSKETDLYTATTKEAKDFQSIEVPEHFIADESAELTKIPNKPMEAVPEMDFQGRVLEVLENFAIEKMKNNDFKSAATFLNQALSGELAPVPKRELRTRLQIRLGICYVLQRKIPEARKILSELERCDGLEDIEVLHLMHVLALVYFEQHEFTEAHDLCTRTMHAKERLLGKPHPETLTSLGLLGHLYDQFDQPIHMEAIRRMMPRDYMYKHPRSVLEFLAEHAMLMPATVLESEQAELPDDISVSEDSRDASAPAAEMECVPYHCLKRALTRYESQQKDTMKAFLSMKVVRMDEEEVCPAPEIGPRNGQKRMLSRSMTTMRRHFSTWRSSKPVMESKERAVAKNADIRRSRTVLHKTPPGSQIKSAGPKGLVRAKRLLSILRTETPSIDTPTDVVFPVFELDSNGNFPVFELDSKCTNREELAYERVGTNEEPETLVADGALALVSCVRQPEPLQVSVRPSNMSLDRIPELPELDSGDGCDVCGMKGMARTIIEDSDNSSDSSISTGTSLPDNRSTTSDRSYDTNTTVSEAVPSSSDDLSDNDNLTVPQSMPERYQAVQIAKPGSYTRSKPSMSHHKKAASLPVLGSSGSWRQRASLPVVHRSTNNTFKTHGRNWLQYPSPMDARHGSINDGYGTHFSDRNIQVQPNVSPAGWRDNSSEIYGLKRTFSWSYGDENISILNLPTREPQTRNARAEEPQTGDGDFQNGGPLVVEFAKTRSHSWCTRGKASSWIPVLKRNLTSTSPQDSPTPQDPTP